jgi:flagellar motor switch protein FliG
MTTAREEVCPSHPRAISFTVNEPLEEVDGLETTPPLDSVLNTSRTAVVVAISPVRKAAIVLVSLEQSLASQLLSHLDRVAVEAVTWEIARLERVDPDERAEVLEEFYGLGLRRLCFVFDDLVNMRDPDIRAAFHEEDLETWAVALAGTAAPQREKVLKALSGFAADRLRQSLEHLGPFRLADAEAAQLEIAESIRRLHDRGRVNLPEPSGRDELIV